MSRALLGGAAAAVFLLLAVSSQTASAQTTINQTTCVPGPGSCTGNGFLQTIPVDCAAGERVANALASITDRNGPNRITISGTCQEAVTVAGFNRSVESSHGHPVGPSSCRLAPTQLSSSTIGRVEPRPPAARARFEGRHERSDRVSPSVSRASARRGRRGPQGAPDQGPRSARR